MEIDDVARALTMAAAQMRDKLTLEETLEAIVQQAAEALPKFEHVGLSTVNKGEVTTLAASSSLVAELDAVQHGIDEGPCVDTLRGTELVSAPRIRHDQRWPNYVPRALEHGLKSQLAMRLFVDETGTVGGLNLYSTSSEEISSEAVVIANILAAHATMSLGRARQIATLTDAVASRQSIGVAIGVLMERYSTNEERARAYLWRASSTGNIKVRDVATAIVREANDNDGSG